MSVPKLLYLGVVTSLDNVDCVSQNGFSLLHLSPYHLKQKPPNFSEKLWEKKKKCGYLDHEIAAFRANVLDMMVFSENW